MAQCGHGEDKPGATMKIACIGGGPAGLYFGLLMKLADSRHEFTVIERHRPYDNFGWGVVFPDSTLSNLQQADPVFAVHISAAFNPWASLETHYQGNTTRRTRTAFTYILRTK